MATIKQSLRKIRKRLPFYDAVRNGILRRRGKRDIAEWEAKGKPVPPPHLVKQRALCAYAKSFGLKIFVETGTYRGDMVEVMKDAFDRIYTIEISEEFFQDARARFRRDAHVDLILGDSGVEIGKILPELDQPALFWLDGHYSGGNTGQGDKDTPIFEELEHILGAPEQGHVIVIDDARCFGTDPAYPTMEELGEFVAARRPDMSIEVKDDSIRVTPKRSGESPR